MKRGRLIKVCGMRDAANIIEVDALDIDLMGFIFYGQSSRNVTAMPVAMPKKNRRVGVFVNASEQEIAARIGEFGLEYVQLHGSESPEFCLALKEKGIKVIKAFGISDAADLAATAAYDGICDMFLFDTRTTLAGGSGRSFDWNILTCYEGKTSFLLSGGIGPDSVSALRLLTHPMLAGYDLNSRFEKEPAIKDVALLEQFLNEI